MARYRKIPIIVDAWQWTGKTLEDAINFCDKNNLPQFPIGSMNGVTGLVLPAFGPDKIAARGWYVVRDITGEYFPVDPETFRRTYEPV